MLASDSAVQYRQIVRDRKKMRPVTMYEGWSIFHRQQTFNMDTSSTVQDSKMVKNTYVYNIREKQFVSCNNLATMKNTPQYLLSNTPTIKRTLSIRRPKSLQRLTDELKPLLDAASSLSSIGSFNELTEESILDSSDDSRDINNVVLRKGGKLRSLKHRPRSTVLSDRSLNSIPETLLTQNLRKRHNINSITLNHTSNDNNKTNELEQIIVGINIKDIGNTSKQHMKNISNTSKPLDNNKTDIKNDRNIPSSKCSSLQNIAVPRRRSSAKKLTQAVSSTSISEQSFSKEQKKRLKKKMRDTKKSPGNSVFLGLF